MGPAHYNYSVTHVTENNGLQEIDGPQKLCTKMPDQPFMPSRPDMTLRPDQGVRALIADIGDMV